MLLLFSNFPQPNSNDPDSLCCNCRHSSTDFSDLWMADRTVAQGLLRTNQLQLAFSWLLSDLRVLVWDASHKGRVSKAPFHLQRSFLDHGGPTAGAWLCTARFRCRVPAQLAAPGDFAGVCALCSLPQVLFPRVVRERERDEAPPADRPTRCQANPSMLSRSWSSLSLDWLRQCKAEKCLAALSLFQHSDR